MARISGQALSSHSGVCGGPTLLFQLPGEGVWARAPYPHGDHDHEGKETRPYHVPGAPAVQLQGHGEHQGAQYKQNLSKTRG